MKNLPSTRSPPELVCKFNTLDRLGERTEPAVREAILSDFGNRYAEGWAGERVYAGCTYIDQVEIICMEIARKLFDAEFADVRPVSGVTANLTVYSAFSDPGDTMMALAIPNGGHISAGQRNSTAQPV